VFVPGDLIQPEFADMNSRFDPAPTPVLPTQVPTATATVVATQIPPATETAIPTAAAVEPVPVATSGPPLWTILIVVLMAIAFFVFSRKKEN
jgi:LPXTG-motif cell wall-anchored protein